ncbi:hypothetical protein M5U04_14400 [Xenorhabdus sp. XENO-1]|nr:hypothetical protein [Xenorhabdus bovienii subsp. africana]
MYQNLRLKAQDTLSAPVNLRDQIGPSFDSVFIAGNESRLVLPQFLTRHGLTDYFARQDKELVELTEMDSWVLNLPLKTNKYSDTDQGNIQREIFQIRTYIKTILACINSQYFYPFFLFIPHFSHNKLSLLIPLKLSPFHISDDLFHLLFAYHIFLFVTKEIASTISILFLCIGHR